MLRVRFLCPERLADDVTLQPGLIAPLQRSAARCFNGQDYSGSYFTLDENDINVIIDSYKHGRAVLEARYILTVTGFDYPDRMRLLAEILEEFMMDVRGAVTTHLLKSDAIDELEAARVVGLPLVAVEFLGCTSGGYVSGKKK